jgi:hypothetical protein
LSSFEMLKADTDIKKQLLETEVILLQVKQSRIGPGGSMFTPVSIYVTNMRVIYRKPIWAGLKSEIIVVNYQDIADIRLKRGVVHTDISLKTRFHTDQLLVRGANNNLSERANALVQQGIRQEHVGQGKHHDFDSLGSVDAINQQKVDPTLEQIDRLAKLADLKQKGALTEEEFHRLKDKLLGNDVK